MSRKSHRCDTLYLVHDGLTWLSRPNSKFSPNLHLSGIHAFMDVRAGGCASTFQSLAFEVVRTSTHGCSAVCVVYDVALRADLTPQPADEEDARVPPAVVELGLRLPELDWSVDYVRGDTMLLERNLIEGSN